MNTRQIIEEARQAGRLAGKAKLDTLVKAGPQWVVKNDFSGNTVGTMLDCCGFAQIYIKNRRSKFWKEFRILAENPANRIFCAGTGLHGGWIDIFDMTNRQEVSVNEAASNGAAEVLKKYGIECYVTSRLD